MQFHSYLCWSLTDCLLTHHGLRGPWPGSLRVPFIKDFVYFQNPFIYAIMHWHKFPHEKCNEYVWSNREEPKVDVHKNTQPFRFKMALCINVSGNLMNRVTAAALTGLWYLNGNRSVPITVTLDENQAASPKNTKLSRSRLWFRWCDLISAPFEIKFPKMFILGRGGGQVSVAHSILSGMLQPIQCDTFLCDGVVHYAGFKGEVHMQDGSPSCVAWENGNLWTRRICKN